ncbi:beta/gamma crystallin-related protein [Fulvivirga ligni]|uniref:beta/gamma crystallin-related protein n=1 Tax=Fulvivirga ligni TaxID=2904246 RepID=UPI001F2C85FA|nr:beta/gamma crystallin-related protein [Fulvivirga ligni]UII20747.1 beta/gamma crystallin-related protein [Fulvivirga ligni]
MAVTIYRDVKFKGRKAELGIGEYARIPIGNDSISSIKVKDGFFVKFYRDSGFRGPYRVIFAGDYTSIPNWNDKISSIEVFEHDTDLFPLIQFYEHIGFKGFKQSLAGVGQSSDYAFPFLKNDTISSMKVPVGTAVVLYKDKHMKGGHREFDPGDYDNLKTFGFNDNVSSIKILQPDLELIKIEYTDIVSTPTGGTITLFDETTNLTDKDQVSHLVLENEISQSITRSFSRSTMVGISISKTATVGVSKGPVSAELSSTITATLENTFTIGEEETKTETDAFKKEVTVTIPPKSIGKVMMMLSPQKTKITAIYTFALKESKKTFEQEVIIEVDSVQKGEASISVDPIEA